MSLCFSMTSSWIMSVNITETQLSKHQIATRAGYHKVPHDTIPSRYFTHDDDNITIQRFCDYRYIARNFTHDTFTISVSAANQCICIHEKALWSSQNIGIWHFGCSRFSSPALSGEFVSLLHVLFQTQYSRLPIETSQYPGKVLILCRPKTMDNVAGFCERICSERLYVYRLNVDICRQHIYNVLQDNIPRYIDICCPHIDNVLQDKLSQYIDISIFWHTPNSYLIQFSQH